MSLPLLVSPWLDWSFSNVLSATQLFFIIAGFSVAISQLLRTANASVASKKLLEKVRSGLLGNDLLIILPELHRLEDGLDTAIKLGDRDEVITKLVHYSRESGRISGLLKVDSATAEENLVLLLSRADKSASKAKAELAEGSDRSLQEVVKVARGNITRVSVEASGLIARLQKRVSE